MEFNLKKTGHEYYEPVTFAPFSCETMRESIVPDSCADIARVIDTTGRVCLTGQELTGDNRFCANGTVDVFVLYIPEKGDGPCALTFQLPFQCYGDGQGEGPVDFPTMHCELQSIDTRVLNPRKVLTRVNLTLYPTGCRRVNLSVCTETATADDSIELLQEHRRTRVISAVREKEFPFVEELTLSPGRDGVEEILSTRLDIRGTDSKLIGNKLVVKGTITAAVLYRQRGGGIGVLQQELPFSQIMDGNGLKEEWESDATFRLLHCDCRIGGENGGDDSRTMTLSMTMASRVTVWRNEEIMFIADLYSTAAPVTCQTAEIILSEDCRRQVKRINGRELLETGVAVKAVVDMEILCSSIRTTSGGDMWEIPVRARCLYLDENDMLHSIRKSFSLTCPPEGDSAMQTTGWADCRGDVMASILPEGIELRFPVDCTVDTSRQGRYLCVSGGETVDDTETRSTPSVVLRKIGKGESLWSVAKQYRTTRRAILEANEISEETQLPADRLLLIPKAM